MRRGGAATLGKILTFVRMTVGGGGGFYFFFNVGNLIPS